MVNLNKIYNKKFDDELPEDELNLKKIKAEERIVKDIKYYLPQEKVLRLLAEFFSMFSDETRIKILSALGVSELCVNDIANILNLNQTTVSHQLKLLKSVGAVKFRRDGKTIYYSIADKQINDCLLSGVNYVMM
ncbi:MAG: winged helix-turn-helix transcriptional regulator [Clostridiales bacterium]|nr:winged helix-turn-helix transcriptional regulator [Clostridiales bacterium]